MVVMLGAGCWVLGAGVSSTERRQTRGQSGKASRWQKPRPSSLDLVFLDSG